MLSSFVIDDNQGPTSLRIGTVLSRLQGMSSSTSVSQPRQVKDVFTKHEDYNLHNVASLFVERYADAVRFVRTGDGRKSSKTGDAIAEGFWLAWDPAQGFWVSQESLVTNKVVELGVEIHDFAATQYGSAVKKENQDRKLLSYIRANCVDQPHHVLAAAKRFAEITISPDDLDADAFLLKVKNGTLDLRLVESKEGPFREDRPGDLITKLAPVEYKEGAASPKFQTFLNEMLPNPEVQEVVQTSLGYALCGDTTAQVFWTWGWAERSGKGTIKDVAKAILGDYAWESTAQVFLRSTRGRDSGSPQPDLVKFFSHRLVFATETSSGDVLDDKIIKNITGEDAIAVRDLYAGSSKITQRKAPYKVIMISNYPPTMDAQDGAIWRRLRHVPFDHTIAPDDQIGGLAERFIEEEASGILNWMLDGYLYWHRNRSLPFPPEVQMAVETYREQSDPIGQFIEERCILDPQKKVENGVIYGAYEAFCRQNGYDCIHRNHFFRALLGHYKYGAAISDPRTSGVRYKVGIALRSHENRIEALNGKEGAPF